MQAPSTTLLRQNQNHSNLLTSALETNDDRSLIIFALKTQIQLTSFSEKSRRELSPPGVCYQVSNSGISAPKMCDSKG